MKIVRVMLCAFVAAVLLLPEVRRYGAEKELFRVSAAMRLVTTAPLPPDQNARALQWVTATSKSILPLVPGDPRPGLMAGSARVLAGDPSGAYSVLRDTFDLGERPEIDLALAKAFVALGDQEKAHQAFLRAAWISPKAVKYMPRVHAQAIGAEVAERTSKLLGGDPTAVPGPLF